LEQRKDIALKKMQPEAKEAIGSKEAGTAVS